MEIDVNAGNLWDTYPDPGKFEGEPLATLLAYDVVMNGCGNDIVSDGDGGDCYESVDCGGEESIPDLFCILYHGSNGFVSAEWFDSAEDRDKAWDTLVADLDPDA